MNLPSPNTEVGGFVAVVEDGLPNTEPPVPPPTNTIAKLVQSKSKFASSSTPQFQDSRTQKRERTKTG